MTDSSTTDSPPTVRSIAADTDHGASTLSIHSLTVLENRATLLLEADDSTPDEQWDELASLARRVLEARPSMAVLRNRVNRAMADVEQRDAAGVLESVTTTLEAARAADRAAAVNASAYADGTVVTLSQSKTVFDALVEANPDRVFVAESRPANEGAEMAASLAAALSVTLHTDAAVAHLLATEPIDCVLVGADTILADGRVLNKTGTRTAALAANYESIPVYVVAATDKITTRDPTLEFGSRSAVYDGDASLEVSNPTFDLTPKDCLSGVITEQGILSAVEIDGVAAELAALESWRE